MPKTLPVTFVLRRKLFVMPAAAQRAVGGPAAWRARQGATARSDSNSARQASPKSRRRSIDPLFRAAESKMSAIGRTASAGIAGDSHCRLPRAHPNDVFTLNNPAWHGKPVGRMRARRPRHRRSSACGDTRIPLITGRRMCPSVRPDGRAGTTDRPVPVERHRAPDLDRVAPAPRVAWAGSGRKTP